LTFLPHVKTKVRTFVTPEFSKALKTTCKDICPYMIEIPNKKIWRSGNSYVFTVPKQLIDNQALSLDREYDITITESETDDEDES